MNRGYLFSCMFSSNSSQSLLVKVKDEPASDLKVYLVYFLTNYYPVLSKASSTKIVSYGHCDFLDP